MVELQINYVLSKKEPRKRDIALRSLPRNIPEAYEEVLGRIGKDTDHLVFRILSWIFHSKGFLRMEELQEALSIEMKDTQLDPRYFLDPKFIVESCKSLVTHEANGISRFTHHTVQSYLELVELVDIVDNAKVLLTYLSFDVFKTRCEDDSELRKKIESHKLSCYTARRWTDFVRAIRLLRGRT